MAVGSARGTNAATAATATRPMTPTTAKVARHPASWPSSVPSGTPTTLAIVSPRNTRETAVARRSRPTIEAAATEAAPKNAPCGRPVRKRTASSDVMPGASAESRLPTANTLMRPMSTGRRGSFTVAAASRGAPTTTPAA